MPEHQILVEQLGMQTAASKDSCEPQVLGKPEGGQLELVPEEGPHETCGSTYSCSLNSSCWDACVLLGFKRDGGNSFLGYSEIFQILFMLIPNSAIQIIFSWWILTNFSSAPFSTSTQAGVLYQRLTDGQHFDNFDGWNLTTLATRTCNGDVISALSGEADTVAAYVKAETFTTAQAGTVIAFLAILIWTLGMVYEMRCTFRLTCSCIATRTDKSLFATLKSSGDNVYTLHQLSMAQKVGVVLLMALPRMAVASLLTVAGIQFLGYSESVSDLILNACALNVIKDVDELVFETLSSRSLKEKVGGTSVELQADTGNVFITSHQVTFFVRLILVLGLSLYGYYGLLEIVASRVQAVDTNVCSNDLEWAWTTHPLSSMPVFVSVSSDSVKSDRLDELSCLYQAKYQMLKVRGGFTTSTLKDNVSGDASACTNNRGQCSGFSMAFFRELKDLTASSIKTQHTSYCVDQDTAYTFLRSACMDHASDRPRNLTKKLQASVDCSGLAGWADCPNASFLTEEAACESQVSISYSTLPSSPATTWLNPAQTHGKKKPYLFTQGQPCLNRALFPCMDTPAVRFTYSSVLRVPPGFSAVMSADVCGASDATSAGTGECEFQALSFSMPQPIPSYLVALAVGDLVYREIGPRSKVWSEPSQIEEAAWEFDGMPEKYLAAADRLFGPYSWDTYDILVMPPSFPFGGMENPRMTFVTPCLLAGDRSLGDVIAHEIAHSWFGNLVTNANWSEFWLNEGFTMFAQRRITDAVHGKAFTALEATTGRKILVDDVNEFGPDNKLTRLRCPIEAGVDPEDTYNEVPYEKGFAMVSYLRNCVGSDEKFDEWLGTYAKRFAFTSIVAEDMFNLFFEAFPKLKEQIDVNVWLHKPGMPDWLPDLSVADELISPVEELLKAWGACSDDATMNQLLSKSADVKQWVTYQQLHFLDQLLELKTVTTDSVDRIGRDYGYLASGNAEVRLRFGLIIIDRGLETQYGYVKDFLRCQGKQKYTLPLYRALCRKDNKTLEVAKLVWDETKEGLHPNVQRAVEKTFAEVQGDS